LRSWWPLLLVALLAMLPLFGVGGYLLHAISSACLLFVFVASWDLFSGLVAKASFGHSFFIGGAGFVGALLVQRGGLTPWTALGLASIAAALMGALVGWLACRFRGPAFALVTMAVQLALFQAVFGFGDLLGGEEGIVGVERLGGERLCFWTVLTSAAVVGLTRRLIARSHAGLVARSIGQDELLASSLGVRSMSRQVALFATSAGFAGLGGALYALTQGQVNAELAGGALSVQVVLLGMIGGGGPGPVVAVGGYSLLRELLAGLVPGHRVVLACLLVAALAVFPRGMFARRER
jgi:branched-chain amino acid transport system permease protein